MRNVGDILIAKQLTGAQLAEYVDATTRLRDLNLGMDRIRLECENMTAAREQLMRDMKSLQSAGTEPISYGQLQNW